MQAGIFCAISIHAPCAGGDGEFGSEIYCVAPFQSTPPVQGATAGYMDELKKERISIHAPCAGGDAAPLPAVCDPLRFQSTPPVQGATQRKGSTMREGCIFQSTPPVQGATTKGG